MGFLHKLWDETLAGPAPDSGLGKLRKYSSFNGSRSSTTTDHHPPSPSADQIPITRSITILRSNSTTLQRNVNISPDSSVPSSPAASTTPSSPLSPSTPGGNVRKLTRRKSTSATLHQGEPRSPTGYDWIVLSALDR